MIVTSRTAILSSNAHKKLDELLYNLTKVYNWALYEKKEYYNNNKKFLSRFDQSNLLTLKRKEEDNKWNKFTARFQQNMLKRLDEAYKKLFRNKLYLQGKGFPRFKGERGVRSFEDSQPNKIKKSGNKWKFSIRSIGVFKWEKELEYPLEKLKLIRIVKTAKRVIIQFIFDVDKYLESDKEIPVGIDLGIMKRATFSDGETVPRYNIDYSKKKKLQRKVSKAKKGSNNRKKKLFALQKEEQRISDRSKGILHEITTDIIKNKSKNIVIEDLDFESLSKKGKSQRKKSQNRNLLDQSLGLLIQMLSYKAESAGGKVVKVNPAYTSKRCSCCGVIKDSLTLSDRVFKCDDCGFELGRDHNAALNILHKGIRAFISGGEKDCNVTVSRNAGRMFTQEASLLTA